MRCNKCLKDQDEDQFPLKKGVRQPWLCKSCKHEYDQTRYATPEGKAYHKQVALRVKERVLRHYGGLHCACCGERELCFLSLDHVDGDGSKHRKAEGTTGTSFYRLLAKQGFPNSPRLQVLCFNCNLGRQVNGGTCPHQEGK